MTRSALSHSFDVLSIGEALIEFNQVQAAPPTYLQGFGGDTSNAIIAAARAGARCAYLTLLGDDHWGQRLLDIWSSEKVDVSGVRRLPGCATGLYFVHHDARGHHFSYARSGSAASRMQASELDGIWGDILAQSQWLHVSGISLAISASARELVLQAMQQARQHGVKVALDTNLRLSLWPLELARQTLTKAAALCDLLLPSLEDMTQLTGQHDPQEIAGICHAWGASEVVLKLGAQGAQISRSGQLSRVPGWSVQAVDATGAGDCFCGNLLARLTQGDDLAQACLWANAAAALSVQGHGAIAPLPSAGQVREFLALK
ncbi:MAG: 2-dehydro-3-deoxygluconokinase [Pseudomonadota bacterium]|jgi:2-dehydro-3-deoxygluconokinase